MSLQAKYPKESILNLEVDNVSMNTAANEISRLIKTGKAYYIVKPYVEFFDKSKLNNRVVSIINRAYFSLPDGVSLNWAAYYKNKTKHRLRDVFTSLLKIITSPDELHMSLPNHSWGTNFTYTLLKQAERRGHSVFLVGAPKKSTIKQTEKYILKKMPNLKISGTFSGRDTRVGYFTDAMEVKLNEELNQKRPDIILVGLGFPVQEKVIARLASKQKRGIYIGEGGTFDFKSFGGKLPKAPELMQRVGLEWLWRLCIEPQRFKRQLAIPRFILQVYRFYKN